MDDGTVRASAGPILPAIAPQLAMVYVRDRNSEGVIRQCLADIGIANAEFSDGGVMTAFSDLSRRASPRLLIVDVTGVDDPVARINQVAEVCGPGTGAIVIGETNDIALYRDL